MAATYCTVANIRAVLIGLGTNADDSILDSTITLFIEDSESIINSYVGVIYTIPFEAGSIPPLIKTICIDLSCYFTMRALFTRDSQNINEWTLEYWKKHIDEKDNENGTLDKIKNGVLPIFLDDGSEAAKTVDSVSSNTENYHTTFDVDDPINYEVDKDRIEEIANDRE